MDADEKFKEIKSRFGPWSVCSGPEIGDGWIDLVYDTYCKIQEIDPDFKIVQIKQKFKGLRFYLKAEDDPRIQQIIAEAENKSYSICEYCAADVEFNGDYLGMTLCDACAERR